MTAGDIPVLDATYSATADYSSYQFSAVTYVAAGTVTLSTANQPAIGILQDKPAAALATCAVREMGHSKARMYSTGTKGDALKVADSYGRLGTGTAGTDIIIGIALETWTATDQIIEVAMVARSNQSASYRAGQLHFSFPISALHTTGDLLAAVPLGFTGTITDAYAVCETVASTSETSATATVTFGIGSSSSVTGLELDMTASSVVLGAVTSSTKTTVGANTFVPANTLYISVVQGNTRFSASDTGRIGIYVVTN